MEEGNPIKHSISIYSILLVVMLHDTCSQRNNLYVSYSFSTSLQQTGCDGKFRKEKYCQYIREVVMIFEAASQLNTNHF